ncbi:two-component system, NarL family, sensor histidine kinase DesK [Promicromonospora umidemergens]|uniref:Signal transduction histidine kinase subgroup 3 dimerisation and phosphoacceptor domain-containing protein n=1 Tax=Promicromonospora umidemergens TaxID=629679 RepID=A0ABP8X8D6_9MICO|nr:histidine kinase [Promicromonospora umidemergens]MCP2281377.1 two-component system, NarL family, sensor histidine kinase DesK [Promicromonospora umidemergens]
MTTQHEPSGGRAGNRAPRRAWLGALLAATWVVFLAVPLREAAGAATVPMRVLGVAGVVGLAALFARSFVRHWAESTPTPRTATLLVAAQLACVALTTLAAGQQGLAGLVLVTATVMMFASLRAGLAVVAVLVLALLTLPRTVPGWQPEDGLVLTALLAGVAMFAFRRATERNRRLHRAQEEIAALAVAQERDRISRDMHDILGHSLTVVSVKGELAARLLRSGPDGAPALPPGVERAEAELTEIQALVRSALADMRGMVADERQVTLAGELAAARSAFDAAGITADLPGAVDEVAERYRDVFAWALREGTTNVLRHAAARRVVVTLAPDVLAIDDDGRGLGGGEQAASGGGNGLRGLTERARGVGLVVETGPSPLGGMRLAVHAPDSAVLASAAPEGEGSA